MKDPTHTLSSNELRDAHFDGVYWGLAEYGACDLPGSGEHRRVKEQWIAAGRPREVIAFIRGYANWLPTPVVTS